MAEEKKQNFFDEESGNIELAAGGALGALAAAEVAVSAVVCPLCVIAAPIFLGLGAYKKIKRKSKNRLKKQATIDDIPKLTV